MVKPLVVGNWKMNGSHQLLDDIVAGLSSLDPARVETAICPPYVYLPAAGAALANKATGLGAQNLSEHDAGAYTGEVSAAMLREVGCRYVIVGHSERRTLFGEDDARVAAKFQAARAGGLAPILCVGESLQEREVGTTLEVIAGQLKAVIDSAGLEALAEAVIAYEPVWAIGTGRTATPEQAQEVHRFIRQQLGEAGAQTRLLYGGSVKASNAAELFAERDIDGALVGGASLKAEEFTAICRQAEEIH